MADKIWYLGRRVRPRLSETGQKVFHFLGIIYLEDLEKNGSTYGGLLAYCDSVKMPIAVSPVHDRDYFTSDDVWSWCEQRIDPETGDLDVNYLDAAPFVGKPKKPHCHILIKGKRARTAQEMTDIFSGLMYIRPSMWEKAEDPDACICYFAHLHSPEKAQYSPFDIHGFGGISLDALNESSKSEMQEITKVIFDIINANNIYYFADVVTAVYQLDDPSAESCLFGRYSLINCYVRSRREKKFDKAVAKKEGRKCISEK